MNHSPFEDWLLDDKSLTADESRQLNAHLRNCSTCTTLAEVDLALESARIAKPAAGFTQRFQVRLAAHKKVVRQRQLWGFILLIASVISLLAWLAWPLIDGLILSPVNWLASSISLLASFWLDIQAMFHAGAVLFKVVPGFIPTYIWTMILFAGIGWSMVWVLSLMKIIKNPQGV